VQCILKSEFTLCLAQKQIITLSAVFVKSAVVSH